MNSIAENNHGTAFPFKPTLHSALFSISSFSSLHERREIYGSDIDCN